MPRYDLDKCRACGAKCCRYVAVEIDTPETEADFDDIRWYVAHENVSVFIEEDEWFISFDAQCQYLTPDGRCAIYSRRPKICANHPEEDCEEGEGEGEMARIVLSTPEDVEEYMARHLGRKDGTDRVRSQSAGCKSQK